MRKRLTSSPRPVFIVVVTTAALLAAAVGWAAPRTDPANAEARYRQEKVACFEGRSQQDTKTCLKEASAALQAARQRDLGPAEAAQLETNVRKRCEALPEADKRDCLARLSPSQAVNAGSVASGGILREAVTAQTDATSAAAASGPESGASR